VTRPDWTARGYTVDRRRWLVVGSPSGARAELSEAGYLWGGRHEALPLTVAQWLFREIHRGGLGPQRLETPAELGGGGAK
jgi:hypothetical protein